MTVTVAIVGNGYMAATHAAGYEALGERVRVKYVVGREETRAAGVAGRVGAQPTTDLDMVLADDEVDGVDLTVPTPLHREMALRVLAADKHVLLEKPIALTIEDADAIVDAISTSSGNLMVGLVLRFWPEYIAMQELIARGDIGEPRRFSGSRLSAPADWNDWMADVRQSGGTAVDLLPHDIDQALGLLGPAKTVSAVGSDDGAYIALTINHDVGGTSVVEGSMAMPRTFPFSSTARIDGAAGTAEYNFRVGATAEGGNLGEAAGPAGLQIFRPDGEVDTISVETADPFAAEVAGFVSMLEQGTAPATATAEQARAALAVSLAAQRSVANGSKPQPVM